MNPYRFQPSTGGHSRGAPSTSLPVGGNSSQLNYYAGGGGRAASTQGRHGNVTPTSVLSFQVGQFVWFKDYVNETFPGGHVVEITGYEQQLPSPTGRPNQSAEWQKADYDTVYRFKRSLVTRKAVPVLSPDQFHPPRHDQLAPERDGQPAARQYKLNALVYLREELYFKLDDGRNSSEYPFRVPRGTLCAVKSYTSRSGGEKYARAIDTSNTRRCCYVLRARCLIEQVEEAVSSHKKESHNFRAATQEEVVEYHRKLRNLVAPRMLDWNNACPFVRKG